VDVQVRPGVDVALNPQVDHVLAGAAVGRHVPDGPRQEVPGVERAEELVGADAEINVHLAAGGRRAGQGVGADVLAGFEIDPDLVAGRGGSEAGVGLLAVEGDLDGADVAGAVVADLNVVRLGVAGDRQQRAGLGDRDGRHQAGFEGLQAGAERVRWAAGWVQAHTLLLETGDEGTVRPPRRGAALGVPRAGRRRT